MSVKISKIVSSVIELYFHRILVEYIYPFYGIGDERSTFFESDQNSDYFFIFSCVERMDTDIDLLSICFYFLLNE